MAEGVSSLKQSVRARVVGKYLGQLAWVLVALSLVPLAVALICGDYAIGWRLGAVIGMLTALSAPLARLPDTADVQINEALTVVALIFLLAAAAMTFPIMGAGVPLSDALFESVSAVTTTGLSTLSTVADKPCTFLFLRAWMQWYGGLGLVVLSVALLMGHQVAARRLAEPAGTENLVTTARTFARRMLIGYLVLTLVGFALLLALRADTFAAVTHVLSSVSTGGFSSFDRSLAGFDSWSVRFAVIGLALCGAIPLPLYFRAYHNGWREALGDTELLALLGITLVTAAALALLMHGHLAMDWKETVAQAALLGVSAQSTAGFSSLSVASLDNASKLVLVISMTIGGGLGSTAGGIKVLRLLMVLRAVQLALLRTAVPSHAVIKPRLGDKAIEDDDLARVLLVVVLFTFVVLLSWLLFVLAGYHPLDALVEVTSATATVGLSTGITAQGLSVPLKLVLCLDMMLGRLEIVALLVLLYPGTWLGKRVEAR